MFRTEERERATLDANAHLRSAVAHVEEPQPINSALSRSSVASALGLADDADEEPQPIESALGRVIYGLHSWCFCCVVCHQKSNLLCEPLRLVTRAA